MKKVIFLSSDTIVSVKRSYLIILKYPSFKQLVVLMLKMSLISMCKVGGFPGGSVSKESTYNEGDTRDLGSVPGSGRIPGVGNAAPSSNLAWKI